MRGPESSRLWQVDPNSLIGTRHSHGRPKNGSVNTPLEQAIWQPPRQTPRPYRYPGGNSDVLEIDRG